VPITDPVVTIPGPWQHRTVSASGTRFHVVEAGDGPLVLLLHGFPQFWWAWRHQLTVLATAGYRAVAADLRGYGGSDHPPRGYDLPSMTTDLTALIRALGESDAVIVGHDWGGLLGWSCAALQPRTVRGLVAVSAPHPLRLRTAVLKDGTQLKALSHSVGFQLPWAPERRLRQDNAAQVGDYLRRWSAVEWPDPDTEAVYRTAFQIGNTPYCALEYFRWAVRSLPRPDGLRYAKQMRAPVHAPVLQIHGTEDALVLADSVRGSQQYVAGDYQFHVMAGVGHYPAEEAPTEFDGLLLDWLADRAHQ
jgi:pimeloyl-ACP methyl ester carboxylesterase